VTTTEPGERKQLDHAPAERYAPAIDPGRGAAPGGSGPWRTIGGPLARALAAAVLGAVLLVLVGAVLASTFGLLFVGGAMGAAIGLLLARAAVSSGSSGGAAPLTRAAVRWLAIALTLAAVVVADIATWLYAQSEGGVLSLLDYLWTTYGPFVPAVPVVAALGAAWGAAAGPVQR
jgi:hypothetical protein